MLALCTQANRWPSATYLELADTTALAVAEDEHGLLVGEPATAATGRAARAAALLRGEPELVSHAPQADAVRMLAGTGGHEFVAAAAAQTGLPEEELRRLVLAHRHGGSAGAPAALGPTPVDPGEAIREIRAWRGFADLTTEPGMVTDLTAKVQVRHGPDGRWYPFTSSRDRWWPAPAAATSPATAFQAALRARRAR